MADELEQPVEAPAEAQVEAPAEAQTEVSAEAQTEVPAVAQTESEVHATEPEVHAAEPEVPTSEAEPQPAVPEAEAAETKVQAAKAKKPGAKAKAQAEEAEKPAAEAQAAEAEKPAAEAEAPTEAPAEPQPVRNERFRWYILHAYSGFERKVRESIQSRVQAFGLKERVGRVMIPTEPVTEIVNGKKRTVERVFLPGYVLVEMELDNELWHVLKDTPKVTGFLGTGDKPVALSEDEVSSILFRSETSKDKPRMKIKFEKSEQVRITDGPFANFNGVVDEINEDRETMKVMVTIFGRSTPVELEFGKVEKIE
jgi:transcriptional antiterminator NusG